MAVNDKVKQGDRWTLIIDFEDENQAPVDQTGFTFACQWRTSKSSTTVSAQADVDMSQAAAGTVTLTVDGTVTRGLAVRKYEYDIEKWTEEGVDTVTLLDGYISVEADTTRPVTP